MTKQASTGILFKSYFQSKEEVIKVTVPVAPLEKSLRLWEDTCLLASLTAKLCQNNQLPLRFNYSGPFQNFRDFRSFLLRKPQDNPLDTIETRFIEKPFQGRYITGDLSTLPLELHLWTQSSRRVYQLSSDLQLVLNATSIRNVLWQDVSLPFDAFAVSLPQPIQGVQFPGEKYDFLLLSSFLSATGHTFLELRLIAQSVCNYQPIPAEEIKLMNGWLEKKRWDKLERRLEKFARLLPANVISPHYTLPLDEVNLKSHVMASITRLTKNFIQRQTNATEPFELAPNSMEMAEEGNTAIRLLVGLCLWLTTKEGRNPRAYTYHEPKQKRPSNQEISLPIINGSQIFTVATTRKLCPQLKEQCQQGLHRGGDHTGITVSPHFREGHWRFPAYHANDPKAEKTVKVLPCIINPHLIKDGQLPNGSKVQA